MNTTGIAEAPLDLEAVVATGADPIRDAILAVRTMADARRFLASQSNLAFVSVLTPEQARDDAYVVMFQRGPGDFGMIGRGFGVAEALLDARPQFPDPTPQFAGPKGQARNRPCPCGSGRKAKKCHPQGVGLKETQATLKALTAVK